MPYIIISGGLTLKVPTRGTTDWDQEFLDNFATPISEHAHTGSGDGDQLGGGSILDDSLDDRKVRLRTTEYLRSRNNAGSGDVDLIRADANDEIEMAAEVWTDGTRARNLYTFVNNQAVPAALGPVLDTSRDLALRVKYKIERLGTANLAEFGTLDIIYKDSAFELVQDYVGDDAGLTFSITGAGVLQYVSTDNPGSSSEKVYIMTERFGD
jgi:hypothetical protein